MDLEKKISNWLLDYIENNNLDSFVVGISGGIDSAVTSTLCAMTGRKTYIIVMPIHQRKDETDRGLSTRLKHSIIAVDGEKDTKEISKFVDDHLLALDARAFRNYVKQITPDIDTNFTFTSNETGDEQEMEIPIEVSFFWPDVTI